jgi:4-hydroxybenzoate polyprenyltransferase
MLMADRLRVGFDVFQERRRDPFRLILDRPKPYGSAARLVLRCGSCRFAIFYFFPFSVGLFDGGSSDWRWILFGATYWLVYSLATELTNRLSDRLEDEINYSRRTMYCRLIGYQAIRSLNFTLWSIMLLLSVGLMVTTPSLTVLALLMVAIGGSICYSYGPRFKRSRYLSLIAITLTFSGPLSLGWVIAHQARGVHPTWQDFGTGPAPLIGLMTIFIVSLAGIKDVTDRAGDQRVGFEGLWVLLVRRRAMAATLAVVVAPFAATAVAVATGIVPERFLWLLSFLVTSAGLVAAVHAADTPQKQQAVKELTYQYWVLFTLSAVALYLPQAATVVTACCVISYWLVTSQLLHWSDGIRDVRPALFWRGYNKDVKVGHDDYIPTNSKLWSAPRTPSP